MILTSQFRFDEMLLSGIFERVGGREREGGGKRERVRSVDIYSFVHIPIRLPQTGVAF